MTQEQILNLIWQNPVEIAHWLGYEDMTSLHNEWLKQLLFGTGDLTLQAHRGSFKTTTESIAFAIHSIIKPNETLIYMRKTDQNVSDICKQVQNILSSGCMQSISKILYGVPISFTRSSQSEIDTNLHTGVTGTAQISGYGINASITGRHADIVVTDDIITLKDRISRAEREHTKAVYQELQNIRNRGGRIINTGTPWHKEDAFSIMPAAEQYDCYKTGLITPEKLHEIQASMTPSLFAANYELKHIASENALFGEPTWATSEETDRIYGGRAHVDAAYGGSDYTAYTILKEVDGIYYGYGKLYEGHAEDCIPSIVNDHKEYRAGSLICEDNGDKGYFARSLRDAGIMASTYHEHENKYVKIATYLKKDWNSIRWIEGTDPEYLSQIMDYTEDAGHDDAPDSAASLLRSFRSTAKANTSPFLFGGI